MEDSKTCLVTYTGDCRSNNDIFRLVDSNQFSFIRYYRYVFREVKEGAYPLFVFPLCNKIFQSDNCIFITNYTLQEMKIAQEDNSDGLVARELTNNIYYVRK